MNAQVLDFYKSSAYQDVIVLHEREGLIFDQLLVRAPTLPRGWFELSHFGSQDRVSFLLGFWESCFPYHPLTQDCIDQFFLKVEDIGVYLVKKEGEIFYRPQLVYSIDGGGFYKGFPPVKQEALSIFIKRFESTLPETFICFLKIHDGFARQGDYGVLQVETIQTETALVQHYLMMEKEKRMFQGKVLEPSSLIPFYKAYGHGVYQCFCNYWYPNKEMGNLSIMVNQVDSLEKRYQGKTDVFFSFIEWLNFYIEVRYV